MRRHVPPGLLPGTSILSIPHCPPLIKSQSGPSALSSEDLTCAVLLKSSSLVLYRLLPPKENLNIVMSSSPASCLLFSVSVSPPSSTLLLFFLLTLQPASSSLPRSPVSGLDPQNLKCSTFFISLPCNFTSICLPSSTLESCLTSADFHSSSPAQTSTSPGSPPPAPCYCNET